MTEVTKHLEAWSTSDQRLFARRFEAENWQLELDNKAAIDRGTQGRFAVGFIVGFIFGGTAAVVYGGYFL